MARALKYIGFSNEFVEVLSYSGRRNASSHYALRCKSCGKDFLSRSGDIPSLRSCGCRREELSSAGHLLYLDFENEFIRVIDHSGCRGSYHAQCKSCQRVFSVPVESLKAIKSCGCRRFRSDEEIFSTTVWNDHVTNARRRGVRNELSRESLLNLVSRDCFYCGAPPGTPVLRQGDGKAVVGYRNGVDRVRNSVGYTAANSVPCCAKCNFAKGKLEPEQFYSWVMSVYKHLKNKGIVE